MHKTVKKSGMKPKSVNSWVKKRAYPAIVKIPDMLEKSNVKAKLIQRRRMQQRRRKAYQPQLMAFWLQE